MGQPNIGIGKNNFGILDLILKWTLESSETLWFSDTIGAAQKNSRPPLDIRSQSCSLYFLILGLLLFIHPGDQ